MHRSLLLLLLACLLPAPATAGAFADPAERAPAPDRYVGGRAGCFDPALPPARSWLTGWLGRPAQSTNFYDAPGSPSEDVRRWILGGGISLPLSDQPTFYDIGGGGSLGVEFPQSAAYGFVVRLDYDHMNEGGTTFRVNGHGGADVAALRAGLRLVRRTDGPLRQYTEAAAGLGVARLSASNYDYVAGQEVETLETHSGVGPAFSVAGGLEVLPDNGGPGFFIESQLVFLFAARETFTYVPLRLGFVLRQQP